MSNQPNSVFDAFLNRLASARVAILFLFHIAVFAGCYAFAHLLRFDFTIPADYLPTFKAMLPVVVVMQLIVGMFFGFYRGWWRYVGISDVIRLVAGLSTSTAVLVAVHYIAKRTSILSPTSAIPRSVLVIDWAFAVLMLLGTRVLIRLGRDRWRPNTDVPEARIVVIIGAGDAGETLAREIQHRPQLGMKVGGFVDDQRAKWGSHIRGIKVHGPISNVAAIARELDADEALIAIPSATGKRIREIIHDLAEANLACRTIPGFDHLVSGRIQISQLRPVNVEDLLRRKAIELPGDPVRALFKGKRVMVTGAGGTIGAELASQILRFDPQTLILVERAEFLLYECHKRLIRERTASSKVQVKCLLIDVQDEEIVRSVVAAERPEIVLHAAAHKHVPLGEQNPAEYLRNNTLATAALANICVDGGVERFVLISTDKAINPSSIMGATKRAAEIILLEKERTTNMKTTVVRFGNVIGSSGRVIPLFLEQIANGGPVTVTDPDVTRYFIRTSEAISLVLQAATLGSGGHIFMLDMGEPIRIVDLARDLIRLSSHGEDDIEIVYTGLRAGEKLFEEIRLEGESIQPTAHPQIVISETPVPSVLQLQHWLGRARRVTTSGDGTEVIALLRDLIPEYSGGSPAQVAQIDSAFWPSLEPTTL